MSAMLPVLDAQHPWPGLFPYGEEAHAFFNGRDQETTDLLRLVRRDTCTLFYGQSGLGKSSLLRAGLFPRLREEAFLPAYLRLDFRNRQLGLREQIWALLRASLASAGIDGRTPRDDESLWEYFHASDVELWDARNRMVTPVLVLDQFEEIVQAGEERALLPRLDAFLDELADLIENRVPASVTVKLEHDPDTISTLDFHAQRFRCVIGFREDFLPALQDRFVAHRMATQSRLRITKMVEAQALAAVQKTGGALVGQEVAERIVAFVAGAGGHAANRVLEIEPALLSVICFELNNRRLAQGEAQISADLLAGAQEQIIAEFYQRSVADLEPSVAVFIERELLTESGYRDSCAVEDAMQRHSIPLAAIQTLVERRVLRQEERFGVLRVELTHDVLAPVVQANRDRRQAALAFEAERTREAARLRRTRRLLWIGGGLATFASVLVIVFFNLFRQANAEKARVIEAQSTLFLSRANASLENNIPAEPVQFLAQALALNPNNQGAIARLANLASQRNFARLLWEKELSFVGEGIGTVLNMNESTFAFISSGNDLAIAGIRMAGDVPTLEETCPLKTLPTAPQPASVSLAYPALKPAAAKGESRIAELAYEFSGTAADPEATAVFARQCARLKSGGRKGGSAEALNVLGMEPDTNMFWANAGATLYRLPLAGGPREHLDGTSDLGTLRRVIASNGGSALLVSGSDRSALFARRQSSTKTDHYLRVATLTGPAEPGERRVSVVTAVFDLRGSMALVSFTDRTCQLWDLGTRKALWSRACGPDGHGFVPDKPWVGILSDHRAAGAAGLPGSRSELALLDVRNGNTLGKVMKSLAINHVEFAKSGDRVVVSAQDRTATVYQLPALTSVGAILLHEGAVVEAHFVPAGDNLITAAFDGSARVWNWRSGRLVVEPLLHPGPVLFARPVLGGTHVLSVADDRRLRLWKIGAPAMPDAAKSMPAMSAPAISLSGDVLAFVESGQWRQKESSAGKLVAELESDPDSAGRGTRVAVANLVNDPSELGPLRNIRRVYQAKGLVDSLVFNADATRLAVAGRDPWLAIVGVKEGKEERRLALPVPARRIVFSRDGEFVVVQQVDDSLRVFSLASGRQAGLTIKLEGSLLDFGVSADGRWITAVTGAEIKVVDLRTGYPFATMVPGGVVAATVHPEKPEVAFSTRGQLAIWRPRLGALGADRAERARSSKSDDGKLTIERMVETNSGLVRSSKKLLVGLRYMPDGNSLAAFSVDGAAWTWDLATMQQGPILRHSNSIVALSLSQDSRWLVTTTLDGSIRVWDHQSGQPMIDTIDLFDSERDFVIVAGGTWALVERLPGRYDVVMLGLGFPGYPPSWFVPSVAALAGVELESKSTNETRDATAVSGWWQSWLGYVAAKNGVTAK